CSARGRGVSERRADKGGRMHEKSKIRLEEILAEHERLRAQAAVQLEEDARRTATFMDRIEAMKGSIIRPVLEETGETLAARGHVDPPVRHGQARGSRLVGVLRPRARSSALLG